MDGVVGEKRREVSEIKQAQVGRFKNSGKQKILEFEKSRPNGLAGPFSRMF